MFFFAPFMAILVPMENLRTKRYLKNFKQNVNAQVVIFLGRYNWFMLETWFRPNFIKSDIVALVNYLKVKKQDFSFYPNARVKDIEKVMSDKSVKEVYFMGHGDSHTFLLSADEILYYCDFNDPDKYGKEFVHQVHCGTPDGKSLIDYVVPVENRAKCFFFRKPINSYDIEKEFKRKAKNIN